MSAKPKPKRPPRKNAPGAGRPPAGRSEGLPRISLAAKGQLRQLQASLAQPGKRPPSLADAVEAAALMSQDILEGRDPRRWLAWLA